MSILPYTLVDVFTDQPFGGNQLAVFQPEQLLTKETMQKIARELNLSETVFVYSPDNERNHRKLRIFTPQMELPMAGHPTIGAAFVIAQKDQAALHEGTVNWVFEEQVGEIAVSVQWENSQVVKTEMNQPLPDFGEEFRSRALAAELLSLQLEDLHKDWPVQTVSCGVPFLYIPIRSLDAMKRISFRLDLWEKHFSQSPLSEHIFTFTLETENHGSTVHSRMFAPAMGIPEDPATGAASGPLGAYLNHYGIVPVDSNGVARIRSEQGIELGRPSYIDIITAKNGNEITEVTIGGTSVIVGKGEIYMQH